MNQEIKHPTMPAVPPRMLKLARHRIMGMDAVVPWFVTFFNDKGEPQEYGTGTPDFRVVDSRKLPRAYQQRLCWVCGEKLGAYMAFVTGPMCCITRTSAEPPSHHDCAMFSAQACPFLTRPKMRRNEKGMPEELMKPGGIMIARNPGVSAVWITKQYDLFRANGGVLVKMGDPTNVFWFAQGRAATREEVMESVTSGYPALLEMALQDGSEAVADLGKKYKHFLQYVPAA